MDSVERQLLDRDAMLDLLKCHLLRTQQQVKAVADGKRRDVHFSVGESVYLKLRPYRQVFLACRRNEKLSPRFYGPFTVAAHVGPMAYRLDLPAASAIHPVFHISQLRRVIGHGHTMFPIPPPTHG